MSMTKLRVLWVIVFLLLILSAFTVPFTPLLRSLANFYGSFLFWNIFAVIVIICLGIITARWRAYDER